MNEIIKWLGALEIFGSKLIDFQMVMEFVTRFSFNFLIIIILVRYIYYPTTKRKDYLFTYILLSTIIFMLCYFLENVTVRLGFALGLFALFGIIRYRTDTIPIKEMTYLFVTIGISVINSLSSETISFFEILLANGVLIFITWTLEHVWNLHPEKAIEIMYENLENIKPENRAILITEIETRLGLKINKVTIEKVNLKKDSCELKIFYYES